MTIPSRDWTEARAKVDEEGCCRACKRPAGEGRPEAAHTAGCRYDGWALCKTCNGSTRNLANSGPCRQCKGSGASKVRRVDPDDVIPLCGPATDFSTCHGKQHERQLDLLGLLEPHEEARVVVHLEGLENARMHLAPSAYPSKIAPRAIETNNPSESDPMKRIISMTLIAILASFFAFGCAEPEPDKSETQRSQVEKKASKRSAYIPTNDVEFSNYNKAQKLYDSPTTIIWCSTTWGNPAAPIITVPVAGKLTSSTVSFFPNSRLHSDDYGKVMVEQKSVDGMYHGTPPPYRYGFTPGGQYVDFFNMSTYCSSKPSKFQRQETKLVLSVDSGLNAATSRAEKALARGDRAGAQRELEEATR